MGRFWSRLLEIEFVDRSVALAAKAFVSFFPLLIVAAALSPPQARSSIVDTIATRFGVGGEAFSTMKQAFASHDQTRAATGGAAHVPEPPTSGTILVAVAGMPRPHKFGSGLLQPGCAGFIRRG